MLISDIINRVNKIIANNSSFKLNYDSLEFYINTAVDYINTKLKTQMLNPQEQWERNLIVNNLLYNNSISSYTYMGEYTESPVTADGAIYLNPKTNTLYYCNEDVWEVLDLESTALTELKNALIHTVPLNFNYSALPDNIIRSVLIYYVAASYLEEEDEFESQYKTYLNRAEDNLIEIRNIYYSMYDLNEHEHHHHKFKNPYGLPEGDD